MVEREDGREVRRERDYNAWRRKTDGFCRSLGNESIRCSSPDLCSLSFNRLSSFLSSCGQAVRTAEREGQDTLFSWDFTARHRVTTYSGEIWRREGNKGET